MTLMAPGSRGPPEPPSEPVEEELFWSTSSGAVSKPTAQAERTKARRQVVSSVKKFMTFFSAEVEVG
jgi:hypothetical protein